MPLYPRWPELLLRLALTLAVGVLIGYNRSQHGKAAGMRTTVLVGLAAAVAMIQVNLLLSTAGRPPTSFVMNDLMRLPLGILTGVGFIGGGAILRRDDIVVGVTTAATLWLVTVIGLCLGGGQIALGLVATVIGVFALWVLQAIEDRLRREHGGRLMMELEAGGLEEQQIRHRLAGAGLKIVENEVFIDTGSGRRRLVFEMRQLRRRSETHAPAVIGELAAAAGVISLSWQARA